MSTVPALPTLIQALRASRGFAHKRDISAVMSRLGLATPGTSVPNGDDCAVLPDPAGHGHLLFAIEGLVHDFVQAMPWFAGYSGVMVNLSDVAAMGGRPLAVVDALWSADEAVAVELLAGMSAAAHRYGVPLVGGHTNLRAGAPQLAVAVLGRAERLITSFEARPGDALLSLVDLRGEWMDPYPFWNASTSAPPERLRADLALLPELAEAGLCDAGKDVSMAGVLGSALMLLECSGVGAALRLDALPAPAGFGAGAPPDARLRWLNAFPSFGYVLAVRPAHAREVQRRAQQRGLACAAIGAVTDGATVELTDGVAHACLWDFAHEPFITGRVRETTVPAGSGRIHERSEDAASPRLHEPAAAAESCRVHAPREAA